jgi:hypothetical protein
MAAKPAILIPLSKEIDYTTSLRYGKIQEAACDHRCCEILFAPVIREPSPSKIGCQFEIAGLSHSVGVKAQTGGLKTPRKFTACKVRNSTVYATGVARAKNISFPLTTPWLLRAFNWRRSRWRFVWGFPLAPPEPFANRSISAHLALQQSEATRKFPAWAACQRCPHQTLVLPRQRFLEFFQKFLRLFELSNNLLVALQCRKGRPRIALERFGNLFDVPE